MGGDQDGYHATIVMLPANYYAIGLINSHDMGSNGLTKSLINAFKISIGISEPVQCPDLTNDLKAAMAKVSGLMAQVSTKATEVAEIQAEIKDLQSQMNEAGPSQKGPTAAMLKAAQAKLPPAKAELEIAKTKLNTAKGKLTNLRQADIKCACRL
jgi:hypothetical protein